jgi:protein O-GlcNAc transferase
MSTPGEMLAAARAAQQAGRLHEAEQLYRQILRHDPTHAESWHLLGVTLLDMGQVGTGAKHLLHALELGGPQPALYVHLGLAAHRQNDLAEAVVRFRQALVLKPDYAEGLNNLAAALIEQGQLAEAEPLLQRALQLRPGFLAAESNLRRCQSLESDTGQRPVGAAAQELVHWQAEVAANPQSAKAHNRLALALIRTARGDEAVVHFRQVVACEPENATAHLNLGNLLAMLGRSQEAAAAQARAVALNPRLQPLCRELIAAAEAAFMQGHRLLAAGRTNQALDAYLRAAALDGNHAAALGQAGQMLQNAGWPVEAAELLRRSVALRPAAETFTQLGNACQDLNDFEQARDRYRQAVEADPQFAPAYRNLGCMLNDEGKVEEARTFLRRSQDLAAEPRVQVLLATALPPVYESSDHLRRAREDLESNVRQLVADGVRIDTTHMVVPTLFYSAYHGLNDRELQRNMARVYRPPLATTAARASRRNGKLRIGLLSKFFHAHTIGRLNLGLVEHLSRRRFEVTVITQGGHHDSMADAFRRHADYYLAIPADPARARAMIQARSLDLIYFADVGMDPLTYTLCLSRLAPVQCATWGHPVTTGSEAMDYFISSELLETADAEEHYTEKLVQLPHLAVYYERPRLPARPRDRASFGFPAERHLYACPQTLFKLHPEFDAVLGGILRADPQGEVLLLEGKYLQWSEMLRARWSRTLPDVVDRIHFLPKLTHDDFMSLNEIADVLLDPIHFGGGNTSYEGLALGTPIVTLPGPYLRSRITLALYSQMEIHDFVVDSPARYIELAVRLGTDADYRQSAREKILAAHDVLYENQAGIRELESFFEQAVLGGMSD